MADWETNVEAVSAGAAFVVTGATLVRELILRRQDRREQQDLAKRSQAESVFVYTEVVELSVSGSPYRRLEVVVLNGSPAPIYAVELIYRHHLHPETGWAKHPIGTIKPGGEARDRPGANWREPAYRPSVLFTDMLDQDWERSRVGELRRVQPRIRVG